MSRHHAMDPEHHDAQEAAQRAAMDADLAAQRYSPPRPTFDDAHLYGPVGDYVRIVAPHTEAAPVAIYATALATVGALLGRGPTWRFGGVDHHARVWPVLIGRTGSGRKGTALAWGVKVLLEHLDPDFRQDRVASGLSSAEGLLHELRDGTPDTDDPITGKPRAGDPGISDKRLLVKEAELGGPLMAMRREGNRLSAVLREAWDGDDLRTLVKERPQRASAPHVVVVAAITDNEYKALLGELAVDNGLANRFLPIATERVRFLAEDSEPDRFELAAVVDRLRWSIQAARAVGRGQWTPEAKNQWENIYPTLAAPLDPSAKVRACLERGAATTRRLAFLFALADGSGTVDLPHLDAALALWQYSADTHRYLFASGAGRSPLADKLLAGLHAGGQAGLSRTDIRRSVGSNATPAATIDAALQELAAAGLAIPEKVPTAGRPVERWRHVFFLNGGATAGVEAREAKEEREEREGRHGGPPDAEDFPPIPPFPPSSSEPVDSADSGFPPIPPFPPSSYRPADTANHGEDPPSLAPGWRRVTRKDGTALDVPAAAIPGGRRIAWRGGGEDVLPAGSGDADPDFLATLADELARVDVIDDDP
jgi:hypothetical protein